VIYFQLGDSNKIHNKKSNGSSADNLTFNRTSCRSNIWCWL